MVDPATRNVSASNSTTLTCDSNGNRVRDCEDLYDSGYQSFSGTLDLTGFTLEDFIGANPIDFALSTTTSFNGACDRIGGSSDSEIEYRIANGALWAGSVTVEYDYVVPAPATPALFGLGLLGLGWSRNRKED